MRGYKIEDGSPVATMVDVNITGNVIPLSWYAHIVHQKGKTKRGKPYPIAIMLLSDIVYWYRPFELRDEATGRSRGYRKKFKGDKLQRSYDQFADLYGYSKRQVKDALNFLANTTKVIDIEFRQIKVDGQTFSNVMFIGLNVAKVLEINRTPLPTNLYTPPPKTGPPSIQICTDPPYKFVHTYTETTHTENGKDLSPASPETENPPAEVEVEEKTQKQRKPSEREKILAELEKQFCMQTGHPLPPRKTEKQRKAAAVRWWNPLWQFYELTGDVNQTVTLMQETVAKMRNDKLTIGCPGSLEKVLVDVYAQGNTGAVKQYQQNNPTINRKMIERRRQETNNANV